MKLLPLSVLAMSATAALAHEGAHIHPHGSDSAGLPLLAGVIVVACLGRLIWVRR